MRKRTVSMDNVVEFWRTLTDEEKLAFADNSSLLKRFLSRLAKKAERGIYVVPLSDNEVMKVLVKNGIYRSTIKIAISHWRKYASDLGYTGPVAWKVKAGFTLKKHAPQDNDLSSQLGFLNDEPTKSSLVFWVPRMVENSTNKTVLQMENLRDELRMSYDLPVNPDMSFGSIALLLALILEHFKRTGERIPFKNMYAVSDSFYSSAPLRIIVGGFNRGGPRCIGSHEHATESVGFFLLQVQELGQ